MRIILAVTLVVALLFGMGAVAGAQEDGGESIARTALSELVAADFKAFCARLDEKTALQLNEETMQNAWAQVTGIFGAFVEVARAQTAEKDGYRIETLLCRHENGYVSCVFAIDAQDRVAGVNFTPGVAPTGGEEAAQEIAPTGFDTEEIALRAGAQDETKACLTLPEGEGPFPCVILTQGSGPSDMDETIYENKPFRDLAQGLALRGVASIRYDKYTNAHRDLCVGNDRFTVKEEYLLDARAALEYLLSDARVGKVFLVGHSQGALLAPRMLKELGEGVSGAAMLAGSPLPLWRIQYEQNLAVLDTLSGDERDEAQKLIESEAEKAKTLLSLSEDELLSQTLFGLPAYYQADEMRVDAVETAKALKLPLFIAQGEDDFQVCVAQGVDAWKAALGDADWATYRLYPGLNHLMMASPANATGTTADYAVKATVSEALLDDLAAWILDQK